MRSDRIEPEHDQIAITREGNNYRVQFNSSMHQRYQKYWSKKAKVEISQENGLNFMVLAKDQMKAAFKTPYKRLNDIRSFDFGYFRLDMDSEKPKYTDRNTVTLTAKFKQKDNCYELKVHTSPNEGNLLQALEMTGLSPGTDFIIDHTGKFSIFKVKKQVLRDKILGHNPQSHLADRKAGDMILSVDPTVGITVATKTKRKTRLGQALLGSKKSNPMLVRSAEGLPLQGAQRTPPKPPKPPKPAKPPKPPAPPPAYNDATRATPPRYETTQNFEPNSSVNTGDDIFGVEGLIFEVKPDEKNASVLNREITQWLKDNHLSLAEHRAQSQDGTVVYNIPRDKKAAFEVFLENIPSLSSATSIPTTSSQASPQSASTRFDNPKPSTPFDNPEPSTPFDHLVKNGEDTAAQDALPSDDELNRVLSDAKKTLADTKRAEAQAKARKKNLYPTRKLSTLGVNSTQSIASASTTNITGTTEPPSPSATSGNSVEANAQTSKTLDNHLIHHFDNLVKASKTLDYFLSNSYTKKGKSENQSKKDRNAFRENLRQMKESLEFLSQNGYEMKNASPLINNVFDSKVVHTAEMIALNQALKDDIKELIKTAQKDMATGASSSTPASSAVSSPAASNPPTPTGPPPVASTSQNGSQLLRASVASSTAPALHEKLVTEINKGYEGINLKLSEKNGEITIEYTHDYNNDQNSPKRNIKNWLKGQGESIKYGTESSKINTGNNQSNQWLNKITLPSEDAERLLNHLRDQAPQQQASSAPKPGNK